MIPSRWKWLAALAGLALLAWLARGAWKPFAFAAILAYLLAPPVQWLATRTRLPRTAAVVVVVLAFVGALGLALWLVGNRLVAEAADLRSAGPGLVETLATRLMGGRPVRVLGQQFTPQDVASRVEDALQTALPQPSEAVSAANRLLETALDVVVALFAVVYLLAAGSRLGAYPLRFVPEAQRPQVRAIAREIDRALRRYLRGLLLLVLLVAVVVFAVLHWAFHLPYALPIAVSTGVLEIIPVVGPLSAGAVACLVGFTQGGPPEAGAIALTYLVLRELEDQLVIPLIVGRAVQVHPIVSLFAFLVGERRAGLLGMLLAVPAAAAAKIVLDHLFPGAARDSAHGLSPATGAPYPASSQARPVRSSQLLSRVSAHSRERAADLGTASGQSAE